VFRCQCNGHSDICDKDRGDNCDCKNNTKSPRCETGEVTKTPCWKFQVDFATCVHDSVVVAAKENVINDSKLVE